MNEEVTLKRSIFGGYKKENVTHYVEAVLEENEAKLRDLQRQIDLMAKENMSLKNQIVSSAKERPADMEDEGSRAYERTEKPTRVPRQYPESELKTAAAEMSLPEGTYVVSRNHTAINLPDPQPVYHVREKATALGTVLHPFAVKNEMVPRTLPKAELRFAPEPEKISEMSHEHVPAGQPQTRTLPPDHRAEDVNEMNDVRTFGSESAEARGKRTFSPAPEAHAVSIQPLPPDGSEGMVKELQEKLASLEEQLEIERKEKQALTAKLDYCTELLLQLYRK